MYVAWSANLQLLSRAFSDAQATLVMRVRFREITGAELLVAGCAGVLEDWQFNDEGQRFAATWLPGYLEDFRTVFGGSPYDVKDDWDNYDRIAPVLTRRLMTARQGESGSKPAKVLGTADRRWWRRGR